jgi:hypothetical protein
MHEPGLEQPGPRAERVSKFEETQTGPAFDEHIDLAPIGSSADELAEYTSAPCSGWHPFRDLLVSWNVDCPDDAGFSVELRIATDSRSPWSQWMYLGDWGNVPASERNVTCDGGKIDTDYFHGERTFERAQLRVRAFAARHGEVRHVIVRELSCCASDPDLMLPWCPRIQETILPDSSLITFPEWRRRIDVPFRSQRSQAPEIAGRICSPTSLTMVLAYRGVEESVAAVAARAFDRTHDIYGNWPRNVQTAYSFGVPAQLTRFRSWPDVERCISAGQPVIASIAAKEGELRGAPYKKTSGHLLVITGFDEKGDVCVNDPAAPDAKSGQTTYARADMQTVWLDRGGTAYLLGPREEARQEARTAGAR